MIVCRCVVSTASHGSRILGDLDLDITDLNSESAR
jgi:hypothetical protein